jgi:hypothetical protein
MRWTMLMKSWGGKVKAVIEWFFKCPRTEWKRRFPFFGGCYFVRSTIPLLNCIRLIGLFYAFENMALGNGMAVMEYQVSRAT